MTQLRNGIVHKQSDGLAGKLAPVFKPLIIGFLPSAKGMESLPGDLRTCARGANDSPLLDNTNGLNLNSRECLLPNLQLTSAPWGRSD
ncbi:hypothetical protein AVEN_144217-1 [Araneus ventricosus]|uniref:Uncharacterized protein n=1 Tax=Araneus ventricosus TaxID=182803 RepID=A0A4Y2KJ16_ARAVE|nr:hypothetical protein AVEN_50930-1 [Araneus ventricosus]GBN02408.1 hypothetical protein AVEN_144217-1 [Araneus ventricosus]